MVRFGKCIASLQLPDMQCQVKCKVGPGLQLRVLPACRTVPACRTALLPPACEDKITHQAVLRKVAQKGRVSRLSVSIRVEFASVNWTTACRKFLGS